MGEWIGLLGKPRIQFADGARKLAGQKPWGLLSYLLLEPHGSTRQELAALLFEAADDPLATLRWSLFQVRRAVEPGIEVAERDGRLQVTRGRVEVDALEVLAGRMPAGEQGSGLGGELLEGFTFDDAPAFENWLLLQRARLTSASVDTLRWAAIGVARRDPLRALALIDRATRLSPFDDALHELAVEAHLARGDRDAALGYIDQVRSLYREELGQPAPTTIHRPLDRPSSPVAGPLVKLDISARALLDSAQARLDAGDYGGALQTARRASSQAAASGDKVLESRALIALSGVLIHTLRGRDREALGPLGRALELALDLGRADLIADAEREVGYVAALEARYGAAEAALGRSIESARDEGDTTRECRALIYRGLCESDRCDFVASESSLRHALELIDPAQDRALHAYALACLARTLVLTGRSEEARASGSMATAEAREAGALALIPWGLVWEAQAAAQLGELGDAKRLCSEAYALGCEIADPCWEALALRGLAWLDREAGDPSSAVSLLEDSLKRAHRSPDTYKWVEALILTDLVELQGGSDPDVLAAARALAVQGPMPDLVARLDAYPQTRTQTPGR